MNNLTRSARIAQIDPVNRQRKNDFVEYRRSVWQSPGAISDAAEIGTS